MINLPPVLNEDLRPTDIGGHFHEANGLWHHCYHQCRSFLGSWQFWLGMTLGFPFEHYFWLHVPFLSIVGRKIMGE